MKNRAVIVEGELEYTDTWGGSYWSVGDENLETLLRENRGRKVKITIEYEEA